MAAKLGSLFLVPAQGPLHYAAQSIMARRVKEGLEQLRGTDLHEALERGVKAVGDEVGVPAATVRAILPMVELDGLAQRIDHNQAVAYEQWDAHAGQTGIMDGIADLTVDGRAPDASLCVLRLARKMRLDKELSEPLTQLSDDLDRWQQLLDMSRILIEDGDSLAKAYKQRRMLRIGIALAVSLAVLAVVIWSVRVYLARDRVEVALAQADPCAVEVDEGDRGKASDAQEQALLDKEKACTALREKAIAEEKAKREKEEAERRAKEREKARLARCDAIARAMKGDGDLPDDLESPAAPFLSRLQNGLFAADDAAVLPKAVPCLGTPTEEAVALAYAKAAIPAAATWLRTSTLSETAQSLLGKGAKALNDAQRATFFMHVENQAKGAMLYGNEEKLARAAALCHAAKAMGAEPGQYCRGLADRR